MTREAKAEAIIAFFNELKEALIGRYETIASCNNDISAYLCPIGTVDEVSYYGKPDMSFRISDHWNWYSNTKKCSNPKTIQCFSYDFPYPRPRQNDKATRPVVGYSVALFRDGKYHVVFGEKYDRKHHQWKWKNTSVDEVIAMLD